MPDSIGQSLDAIALDSSESWRLTGAKILKWPNHEERKLDPRIEFVSPGSSPESGKRHRQHQEYWTPKASVQ